MHKGRLEAFSDAVIAIIMTIMVLELHAPKGSEWSDLLPMAPIFGCYLLSFVFLGIYWNNHHHMLQAAKGVNGAALWANMNLLFWLSLIPFATEWLGQNHHSRGPIALYGFLLLMCGSAYFVLSSILIAADGKDSKLAKAVGKGHKEILSVTLYASAIAVAIWAPLPYLAFWFYIAVAMMWLIPDRRIERQQ